MDIDDFLYIVLPGIGGSVLERRRPGQEAEVLWRGLGQLPSAVLRAGRLELGDDDHIVATGLLEDWRFVGLTAVDGYRDVVLRVADFARAGHRIDWGDPDRPDLDARVVCFPFDFRRSVSEAAHRLNQVVNTRLEHLGWEQTQNSRPVVLIAHSMGGLVARYWAGPLGGYASCRAIVTLGTPHRGAPKALDVLANGWRLGPSRIPGNLSQVMGRWPGLHELLPRYRAARSDGAWVYPKDLTLPGLDAKLAGDAFGVHADIASAWKDLSDNAPSLTPVIGVGKRTLESATVSDRSALQSSGQLPADIAGLDPALARFLGDGTVPRISAIPIELDQHRFRGIQRVAVGAKHGGLMNWPGLEAELELLLTGTVTAGAERAAQRELVLDLPDAWPAGTPVEATARIYDVDPTTGRIEPVPDVASVQYRWNNEWIPASRVAAGPDVAGEGLGADREADWLIELPALPAGATTVEVRAATDSGDDPTRVSATLHVLAAELVEEFGS